MEDVRKQVADLRSALEEQRRTATTSEERLARTERELSGMKGRLCATWACALIGTVGAFVLGLSPDAQAQFGVTLTSLNNRLTAVENKTHFVTVSGGEMFVTGTNLNIRSGSGSTEGSGSVNGKGNLIIGYNEAQGEFGDERGGSHNLVVGIFHDYVSYGGLVAGLANRIAAPYASISGGQNNIASGRNASCSGGSGNDAVALNATVSGGTQNVASGESSSVSGGRFNNAGGFASSVSGGRDRIISFTGSQDWRAGDLFQDF